MIDDNNSLQVAYCYIEATLKNSLFSVQRVAEIMASWAAAIFFFFFRFFFSFYNFFFFGGGGKKILKFLTTIFFWQNEKKKFPFCRYILTRQLDPKQHFFQGWPDIGCEAAMY